MTTTLSPASDPQKDLQTCVDRALGEILPALKGLRVKPFGSRVYDAAGPQSDYDFYLELPKGAGAQGKVLRGCIRQRLIDAKVTSWPKSHDQLENNTLKWTTLQRNHNVSINIAEEGVIGAAVLTTQFLKHFFRQHPGLRQSAMTVAQTLRDAKQMATEGTVGDTLKSAPFFMFCAAIHSRKDCSAPATLFAEIATFDASQMAMMIELPDLSQMQASSRADAAVATSAAADAGDLFRTINFVARAGGRRADALMIVVAHKSASRNIAQRVTEPRLALIQHTCAAAIGMDPPIPSGVIALDFDLNSFNRTSRHLVTDIWTHATYPAVTIIWKNSSAWDANVRVLVVLTGNGNDRYIHSDAYDFLLCVTWGKSHETNPGWLPGYLLQIATAANNHEGGLEAIDVLGISRGHCALMACCEANQTHVHLRLAEQFRHFLVGGGCIWQRQDSKRNTMHIIFPHLLRPLPTRKPIENLCVPSFSRYPSSFCVMIGR